MKGKFNWIRTPIVPLGTKAMIYTVTDAQTTFAPHCDTAFVTGMAPHYYHLLKFCVPATRGYCKSGTYYLTLAHCMIPTVSEADRTVLSGN